MNILNNMDQIYKLYEFFPLTDNSKHLILEPLSCVLKISLLQHKSVGTKISVANNALQFHEPSFLQGLTRSLGGDSRQDLHNVCHPIIKSLEWYPLSEHPLIYEECLRGLEIFKQSYEEHSLINHTIDHYIGLVSGKEHEPIEDNNVVLGLKDIWSQKEVEIVKSLIENINEKNDDEKGESISVLEQMLIVKEQKVNTYIQTVSTSY
jgi:hypothetical protein|tara:strand:+ start:44 stop:664 length:621 start_codon:yes stop_codon:yes gene_type:complete